MKKDTWTIRSENAEYNAKSRRFHVDASTIGLLPGMPAPLRVEVVSRRTGESAFYVYNNYQRYDLDGSTSRWEYVPEPGDENACRTRGVTIWND